MDQDSLENQEPEIPDEIKRMVEMATFSNVITYTSYHGETLLVQCTPGILDYVPKIHENTVKGIVGDYRRNSRISRAKHQQLASIARGVAAMVKEVDKPLCVEIITALKQCKQLDAYAKQLSDARRDERRGGNVKIVDEIEEDWTIA